MLILINLGIYISQDICMAGTAGMALTPIPFDTKTPLRAGCVYTKIWLTNMA
jgi:hypothetical protein